MSDNALRYTYDSEATLPNLTFSWCQLHLTFFLFCPTNTWNLLKIKTSARCSPRSAVSELYCQVNSLKKYSSMFEAFFRHKWVFPSWCIHKFALWLFLATNHTWHMSIWGNVCRTEHAAFGRMDSQKHLTCECSQAVSSIVLTITISHTNNSLISEQLAIMKVSKSGTKQINRQSTYRHLQCNLLPSSGSGWWWWWRRPQAQTCWSIVKAVLYTTSAAGVLPPQTFSHLRALWK